MQTILKAGNIYKSFGPTRAVSNFSIAVERGEIRGLIGENGSGKSTFSSILAGILTKDEGELFIDGKPYDPQNAKQASAAGVSLVVQEIGTIADITVAPFGTLLCAAKCSVLYLSRRRGEKPLDWCVHTSLFYHETQRDRYTKSCRKNQSAGDTD